MNLSQDIITAFVKITNDNKKKNTETTLYGTTVIQNGSKFVKIDGSDVLTPVQSTAVIRSGARVTILLKDHQAIVTGNLTDPSASSGDVSDIGDIDARLEAKVDKSEFELTINELLATIAELTTRVDELTTRVDELTTRVEKLEKPDSGTTA